MAITKRNNYMIFVLITFMVVFLCRIPLYHMMGELGMTSFGIANELFVVIGGVLFYSMQEAVASLVRYRVKREQYRSAQKVFHRALLWTVIGGTLLMIVMLSASKGLAASVFHMPHATLSIRMVAAAILFLGLTGVFRGFFLGHNMRAPLIHSGFVFAVVFGVTGCIGSYRLMIYGQNVSALLRSEEFQYAYGAVGASVGLLIASVICFLYLLVLYFLFRSSLVKETGREYQKNKDSKLHIFHMLLGTGSFYAVSFLIFYSSRLLEQLFYFTLANAADGYMKDYGNYYAKADSVSTILGLAVVCVYYPLLRRVLYLSEREEHRAAREKMGVLLHKCAAVLPFVMILVAVLAENILALLFGSKQETASGWLQLTNISTLFMVFAFFFLCFLVRMKQGRMVLLLGGGALLLRLVVLVILLSSFSMGVAAIAISRIVGNVFLAASGFLMVSRSIQYHQEWIRNVAIPVMTAAASGVFVMLLNQLFCKWMGKMVSFLLCLVLATVIHIVLLLITRNFREEEINNSILGRWLIQIGKNFNFF